ncbi:hypothetical protein DC31_05815 [Microbacterium sp. CH12i]|uniref:hypothetical protein n=1 Tax=Microbacterium sp. CH12i TaxID=1479651 RepID=UPI0004619331|nr:hypothetical protein [Microbacterium sp. CH12i]KDA04650.1 hypothetical protein DC31_05815 [Microbacterium sp. CH12i]
MCTHFTTITTRLYSTEEREPINARNLAYRLDDLTGYGRNGYALTSTVTAPAHDASPSSTPSLSPSRTNSLSARRTPGGR